MYRMTYLLLSLLVLFTGCTTEDTAISPPNDRIAFFRLTAPDQINAVQGTYQELNFSVTALNSAAEPIVDIPVDIHTCGIDCDITPALPVTGKDGIASFNVGFITPFDYSEVLITDQLRIRAIAQDCADTSITGIRSVHRPVSLSIDNVSEFEILEDQSVEASIQVSAKDSEERSIPYIPIEFQISTSRDESFGEFSAPVLNTGEAGASQLIHSAHWVVTVPLEFIFG